LRVKAHVVDRKDRGVKYAMHRPPRRRRASSRPHGTCRCSGSRCTGRRRHHRHFWGWGLKWWTPAFLMRVHGFSVDATGATLGRMHLLGGIVGTLATSVAVSPRFARDSRRVVWLMAAVISIATIPSMFAYWTHSRILAIVALWAVVPAVYFFIGPTLGLLQNVMPSPCARRRWHPAVHCERCQPDRCAPVDRSRERCARRAARGNGGIAARGASRPCAHRILGRLPLLRRRAADPRGRGPQLAGIRLVNRGTTPCATHECAGSECLSTRYTRMSSTPWQAASGSGSAVGLLHPGAEFSIRQDCRMPGSWHTRPAS